MVIVPVSLLLLPLHLLHLLLQLVLEIKEGDKCDMDENANESANGDEDNEIEIEIDKLGQHCKRDHPRPSQPPTRDWRATMAPRSQSQTTRRRPHQRLVLASQ